jgi:hypothetical protein
MINSPFAPIETGRAIPRIALDFTTAALDSRVTIARALNTATRVNSSGYVELINANLPRFDYNPVTLACKGLLIEEARTNILPYSNDFRDTATAGSSRPWVYDGATVTINATTSPDGTANANKLTENTATSAHAVRQTMTTVASTTYAASVFVKGDGSGRNVRLYAYRASSPFTTVGNITVRLTDGALLAGSGTIIPWGNGWYLISISGVAPTTSTIFRVDVANVASTNYLGDGTSGIFIYGGQLEVGAFSTSYIPTTTATVTRNADVVTMVGANFSDWWQAGKGSALVRVFPNTVSGIRPVVQFDDTTANNIIALQGNTTNPELYVRTGGVDQAQIDAGTIAANTSYRLAGAWATDSCAASVNSGTPVLDGVATIPVVTQARLGSDGTNYLNANLAGIEYYNERIRNSTLQVVSSTAGYQSIISPVISDVIIS